MIRIKCGKCEKVSEHEHLNLLHDDLGFFVCPICKYISGHNGKLAKIVKK